MLGHTKNNNNNKQYQQNNFQQQQQQQQQQIDNKNGNFGGKSDVRIFLKINLQTTC